MLLIAERVLAFLVIPHFPACRNAPCALPGSLLTKYEHVSLSKAFWRNAWLFSLRKKPEKWENNEKENPWRRETVASTPFKVSDCLEWLKREGGRGWECSSSTLGKNKWNRWKSERKTIIWKAIRAQMMYGQNVNTPTVWFIKTPRT